MAVLIPWLVGLLIGIILMQLGIREIVTRKNYPLGVGYVSVGFMVVFFVIRLMVMVRTMA